ncbi:MAG: outer membrane protein assembly factor BamA [Myxococcales bacterium]|nr:MAG: outer membrane protein assembly factor BamA [Myxococcales bacterium]
MRFSTAAWIGLVLSFGVAPVAWAQDPGADPPLLSPDAPTPTAPPTSAASGDDSSADEEISEESYEPNETPSQVPKTVCDGNDIVRLVLRGNRRVSSRDIQATTGLKRGSVCRDEDVARAAHALWKMGYFDDIIFDAKERGSGVVLSLEVRERPAIGAIRYEGNDELDDEDLEEVVDLTEGEILSVPEVRKHVVKLRDKYAEEGHYLARIDYKLTKMPNNEVAVVFMIREGDEVTVRRMRFSGNYHLDDEKLRGIMQTSETGFFSFLSSSDTFQKSVFEEDVNRLQAYYYDQGYLNAQIGEPRVEITADRKHIDIGIDIEEGPRFKVGEIVVTELDSAGREIQPLGGKRKLRNMIDLERDDWFSSTTIQKDLLEITRMYRDEGYAKAVVRPETKLDHGKRIVDINVSIARGPKVYVERINIRGNTRTADEVIRREMRLLEGELYNQSKLDRSKERIMQLGYFERVDFSESAGTADDRLTVNVEVAERSTGTFQIGAGFSSIESFILTAQVQQQNIFGRGQSLSLQLQLSGIRQLAQLRFVEPYFLDTEWTMAIDAYKTSRQFSAFNQDRAGGRLAFGHPIFHENLQLFGQYTLEYVDISSRTSGFFGTSSAQGFNIFQRLPLANLFRAGITSSATATLTWDSRDNRLFPAEGVYASLSSEVADEVLGSNNTFIRHRLFGRYYYPLFNKNVVLKLNTELGLITSRNPRGVPIFERFYLGGMLDVRGYYLRTLGPRIGLPRSTDPNGIAPAQGVVVGGNLQAFYNLELEFPIVKPIGIRGVVFTDGGNTWNLEDALCQAPQPSVGDPSTDACSNDFWRLRTSWGFGFRWISQVLPPLRFEWGIPFSRRSYERSVVFNFSFGNSF